MSESQKFPLPGARQENIEEALGILWHRKETGEALTQDLRRELDETVASGAYALLLEEGHVTEESGRPALTPSGETLGRDLTRRLRLAERLLTDVLSLDRGAVDPNACRLEHIISPEVTASICTLLGHPSECPHGLRIPPGDCCAAERTRLEPIVTSLDRLAPGDGGKVAYVRLADHPELHKLFSLGIIPGSFLTVHQTVPAFVVEAGETQIALEESVAANIFVRRI
jgi:DtxR family Mn-dependent transcriptional regulator